MEYPGPMIEPARRLVTWEYPDNLPAEPFFMVYHPCPCGHEVRFEAVSVHSYLGREFQAAQQEQMNNYANQALAIHLAENYQYPPLNRDHDDNNENNENNEIDDWNDYNENHDIAIQPDFQIHPREPDFLAPVHDEWLDFPGFLDEEFLPRPDIRNITEEESKYQSSCSSDDKSEVDR